MLFNLSFASNTILSCFFFFFSVIELCSLFPASIAELFYPIAEPATCIRIPRKETKAAIEMHPVIVEDKITKCSV